MQETEQLQQLDVVAQRAHAPPAHAAEQVLVAPSHAPCMHSTAS